MRILKDIYGLFSSARSQFWFHNVCGYVTWWWSHDWQNLSKSFTWSKSWLLSKREFEAAFSPNEVCLPATQRFKHKNQINENLTRPWMTNCLWYWPTIYGYDTVYDLMTPKGFNKKKCVSLRKYHQSSL